MINKMITSIVLGVVLMVSTVSSVGAVKTVCTQNYGQPVVCTEEVEQVLGDQFPAEHIPKDTGLVENVAVIGGVFIAVSLVLRYKAGKSLLFIK